MLAWTYQPDVPIFSKNSWEKYFDMCPLGTKQQIPNSLFNVSLHKRNFLTNVGKPSRPFKFQHLIWQARNIFYNNVHKTKKQKTVCSSFSATGLIRYVEMVKRIFTNSKHWLTGVNIPPANKNRQCTAIITMGIKQEQAQFTPNQNSTTTICNLQSRWWKKICNPTEQEKLN